MAQQLDILIYDIETAPLTARPWRPDQKWIGPHQIVDDTFILTWSARWWGTDEPVFSERVTGKEAIARDDKRVVSKLGQQFEKADVIVAHYGDKFDWPHVNGRLSVHGLNPPGYLTKIDTKKLAAKHFNFASNSLDYLAKMFGVEGKSKVDWELWERILDGPDRVAALKEMEAYNRQDVVVLENVFEHIIPYVDRLARLYEATYREEDICPYCGSDVAFVRGYYNTQGYSYPKLQCQGRLPGGGFCGKYRKGRNSDRQRKTAKVPI